jgi:hypothetical protein
MRIRDKIPGGADANRIWCEITREITREISRARSSIYILIGRT